MTRHNGPQLRSVRQMLADGMYSIPVYQRNYAWGDTEIRQLIEDVQDYAQHKQDSCNYYVGTLVVYERRTDEPQHWEVVDGQQRLTTLILLASVLGGMHTGTQQQPLMTRMPLQFECREASSQALQSIFANPLKPSEVAMLQGNAAPIASEDASGASSIWEGRAIIEDVLQEMREDERLAFSEFLLNRVQLLRVELPPRTDLNHYFECMNNRGEQLAKHEVLKARLLGDLQHSGNHTAMQMLHAVWDACAVMDRSVQSGFSPALRRKLFSADGRTLAIEDLGSLLQCFVARSESPAECKLTDLLKGGSLRLADGKKGEAETAEQDDGDEGSAQFGAVINFPNFLLQVLAMMPGQAFADTPLDDKQLLTAFEPLRGDAALVQGFTFRLLRCRFLLDQYVIKSSLDNQVDEEHWQLQRCKFKNDKATLHWVSAFDEGTQDLPERLRMLQAALHVSYMLPTRKHWLQGALRWLCRQEISQAIDARAYLLALEGLAKAFVLEVGAHTDTPAGYEEVAHREGQFFEPQQEGAELVRALPHKLVYGRARLIDFNFLDYVLWLQAKDQGMADSQEWRNFAFTSSRRSVEHLHPQTELFKGNAWSDEHLHAFGNLCLVSHAMNSRLRNSGPEDKFKQLMEDRNTLSLKIFSMHRCFERDKSWLADQSMASHATQMLDLLSRAFATHGLIGSGMNSIPGNAEVAIA